jgi:hypothetical protein
MPQERKQYIESLLTKVFKKELALLCESKSTVVILDGYEHSLTSTADWIQKHMLEPVRQGMFPRLLVVLSGRPEGTRPKFVPMHEWSHAVLNVDALSEFDLSDVDAYFSDRREIDLDQDDLNAYFKVCKGNPLIMGQIADILDTQKWSQ